MELPPLFRRLFISTDTCISILLHERAHQEYKALVKQGASQESLGDEELYAYRKQWEAQVELRILLAQIPVVSESRSKFLILSSSMVRDMFPEVIAFIGAARKQGYVLVEGDAGQKACPYDF